MDIHTETTALPHSGHPSQHPPIPPAPASVVDVGNSLA
jgi:hypothetical protein